MDRMYQTVAITPVTMKRLMNYQCVVERKANAANERQWQKMTAENMRLFEVVRIETERLRAIVTYAGFLFRVQNCLVPYRVFPFEYRLHNALVELMNVLSIPVLMIAVNISENDSCG